jgi:hypothetical protein
LHTKLAPARSHPQVAGVALPSRRGKVNVTAMETLGDDLVLLAILPNGVIGAAAELPPLVYPGFRGSAARRRIARAARGSGSAAGRTQAAGAAVTSAPDEATDAAVRAAADASVRASIDATAQAVIWTGADTAHHANGGSGHAGGHH